MRLPFPFLKQKKKISIYYLALLLTSEKATGVILEESLGKLKIISKQSQFFTEDIEDLPPEELIETADKVISRAEEILPPSVEIRKTVFGIKESWVEDENKKIKKNYLQKLKKICDSLDLSPIGFMVISEAIANLMQEEEGAPLSAIFVELGKKTVTLTLFRGGKSVQTVDGIIEGTYASTVDSLLKYFTIEVLPARIILYDTEISQDLVQQFIGHLWSKSLPFLHMPQISVLASGFDGRAVAFGAAAQMGFEALDAFASDIKTYNSGEEKILTSVSATEAEREPAASVTVTSSIPTVDFGFIIGQDIDDQKLNSTTPASQDVKTEDIISDPARKKNLNEADNTPSKKGFIFPSIHIPTIKLPSIRPKGPRILIISTITLIIIGLLSGGAFYFYMSKVSASVLITLKPEQVTQQRDVLLTVEDSNNFSKNVLGAKTVNKYLEGDMTAGATGKKDIGDKAKGSVTVYNNNTDSSVSLSSGSVIKTESGLEFMLDRDVTVASASGDIFSGTRPGTTSIEVTAADIGTNYNLPSGTKFSIVGNNSMAAKNDSAFSGGSKKTVTVVSKDDLAKLKTELLKNLEEKAGNELAGQTDQDSIVLPVILSTDIEKTKFDKNAGDEAKAIKLSAGVNFFALSYPLADTKKFAKEILQESYSKNKTVDEDNIKTKIIDAKLKSPKEITATLVMNATLLPKIDDIALAKQLSGKTQKDAQAILSRLSQVERSEIRFKPDLYFLSKLIPSLPNHVVINISSN